MHDWSCSRLSEGMIRRPRRRRSSHGGRRILPLLVICLVLLTLVLGVSLVAWRDTSRPILRVVHVPVQGLSRTYRILQVSDLHGSRFGEGQDGLARLVEGERYDAIALTGDMVSVRFADSGPAVEVVEALKDNGPVYFVRGNHDDDGVAPVLTAAGAVDLDAGGAVRLGLGDEALVLSSELAAAAARENARDVIVVLTHVPPSESAIAALAALPTRAAVVLTGHTHGGTVRLPFVGAIVAPPMGDVESWTSFPEMRGIHVQRLRDCEGVWVHISPGLGPGTYAAAPAWWRFRLGARAEIDEIVLEPAP